MMGLDNILKGEFGGAILMAVARGQRINVYAFCWRGDLTKLFPISKDQDSIPFELDMGGSPCHVFVFKIIPMPYPIRIAYIKAHLIGLEDVLIGLDHTVFHAFWGVSIGKHSALPRPYPCNRCIGRQWVRKTQDRAHCKERRGSSGAAFSKSPDANSQT